MNILLHERNAKTSLRCLDGDLLTTGKFLYSTKEKMNFKEAQKFCTNFGLQLPMPASITENNEEGFQNDAWVSK